MANSAESVGYLMPRTKNPGSKNQKKNGMFINQPNYMQMGNFTGPTKLRRTDAASDMKLEKGGPTAQAGKPIG